MPSWTGAAATHLASGADVKVRVAFLFKPRTFADPPVQTTIALWTGSALESFTLDGVARNYQGIGEFPLNPISYRVGTEVGYYDLALALTPQGEDFVRTLDTRQAPAEIHQIMFHPDTGALLGTRRMFRGEIDAADIATAEEDGVSWINLSLVTSARRGTMTIAGKKSRKSQEERYPGDLFRQYGDLGTTPNDPWGGND